METFLSPDASPSVPLSFPRASRWPVKPSLSIDLVFSFSLCVSRLFPITLPWGLASPPTLPQLCAAAARSAFLHILISGLLSKELKDISNPTLPENTGTHLRLPSSRTHIQLLQRSDTLPCLNNRRVQSALNAAGYFLAGGSFYYYCYSFPSPSWFLQFLALVTGFDSSHRAPALRLLHESCKT